MSKVLIGQEVIDLMSSSNTESEWNSNADKVKEACGGYPNFWFRAIVLSGLLKKTAAKWGSDGEIKLIPLG